MAFLPYLNLGTNCREAFNRDHEIFGGELVLLGAGDMPSDEPLPPEMADMVIHAALKVGDDLLMASEVPEARPVQYMYVNWTTTDSDEARRVFDALADGGDVEMPMEPTFWSPAFGVTKDRFGVPWMISADPVS